MYAIIKTGGKQYQVKKNDELFIEKLAAKTGDKVTFNEVLLVNDTKVIVGNPTIKGASVSAKVIKEGKQKKVIIFKYKDKNNDAKKKGHRQPYTKVKITDISLA